MTQSLWVLLLKACPPLPESCSWKRFMLFMKYKYTVQNCQGPEKNSASNEERRHITLQWKGAQCWAEEALRMPLFYQGTVNNGIKNKRPISYQQEQARGIQSLCFRPFSSLSFSFFKVSWAPLGWQIGGRLDITVNVNESGCQMNWKSHCLLDSLIIGSHWLSHSIICITKDYQKLDNAFSCPLPLHSHHQSRSNCLCPCGWTCREFLSH